jgi:hypothetical protein
MDGILRQLNGLEGQIEKVLSPLSPLDRDDAHFSKMGAKSREGERVLAAMACTIQAHLEL